MKGRARSQLWPATWAVARKDIRIELRTRYAINAMLLFAVTTAVMVSFRLGPLGVSRDDRAISTLAVLLWVAIFFAAMNGLSRTFVREEETRTVALLRLSTPPLAVYLGKLLVNLGLLALLETLVTLLFVGLMNVTIVQPGLFAATLALGGAGLAGATTIIAALVAKADGRSALFAVLAFPLLLPLLIIAVETTEIAMSGAGWANAAGGLRVLFAYGLAQTVASLLLFERVWEA
ncbi:MAG TPA: heme exporter protein CcmB [Herpetosiphonaceae bacterium]|nr:heme exporter protein CcmB [Herpetosiphonaceae bacterium]